MAHAYRTVLVLLLLTLSLPIDSQTRDAGNWESSSVLAVNAGEARTSSEYDWSEKNESWPDLSPLQLSTVLLAPCPPGVVPNEADQYVYVEDGSNSEAVMLANWSKPGTCRPGQASGTINFYPSRHHTAGRYAVRSASGGLQEALNASRVSSLGSPRGGVVRVPSGTELDLYAKVSVHGWDPTLDLSGVQIKVHQSDIGLCVGDCAQQWKPNTYFAANVRMLVPKGPQRGTFISLTSGISGKSAPSWDTAVSHTITDGSILWTRIGGVLNSALTFNATVISPRMQPQVDQGVWPAISVNAQKTRLFNVTSQYGYPPKGFIYGFGSLVEVLDDQAFLLDGLDFAAGLGTIHCDTSFCGSVVSAPGPFNVASPVGWLKNMNVSLQCGANGVDWQSGNTLHISDSVIQGYTQFGVRYSMRTGGYGGLMMDGVYMEYGNGCPNPLYAQVFPGKSRDRFAAAGIIVQGRSNFTNPTFSYRGGEGPAGNIPIFTGAGDQGPTVYSYYVVAHNEREQSYSVPILFGVARPSRTESFKIAWPDMPDAQSFDILRVSGSGGAATVAPYGTGPYAIQAGLNRAEICDKGICVSEDSQTTPSQYTVQASAMGKIWVPFANWWPGAVVLESTGSGTLNPTNMPTYYTDLVSYNSTISFSGGAFPQIYGLQCGNPGAGFSAPSWSTCLNSYYLQSPIRYMTGPQQGGYQFGAFTKGKLNIGYNSVSSGPLHLVTLFDSNPDKSSAYGEARAHLCTAPGYATNSIMQRYGGEWSDKATYAENDWVQHGASYYLRGPSVGPNTDHVAPPAAPWIRMTCDDDVFIGIDAAGSKTNVGLSIGSTGSISRYIKNIGDGTHWAERLTANDETFRVPVKIESTFRLGSVGSSLSQLALLSTAFVKPAPVPPRSCSDQKFQAPNLNYLDVIGQISPPSSLGNLDLIGYPAARETILLHFCNPSDTPVTPPPGAYRFSAIH